MGIRVSLDLDQNGLLLILDDNVHVIALKDHISVPIPAYE